MHLSLKLPAAVAVLAGGAILAPAAGAQTTPEPPRPSMVVIIGIDGLSTDGLQFSRTPNLDTLIRRGALSLETRAVMPTVSAPNWASMLTGAGPEQHGVTKNGWTRETATIEPAEKDADGYFPSIFNVVRSQMPGARTAMFYDWDELRNFYNPKQIDERVFSTDYGESVRKAGAHILSARPALTFLYIGHADDVGHESGHGTAEYWKAVADVDRALGELFATLKRGKVFDSVLFFVISDHGGVGHGHGGESMDEIEVPWIVSGPGTIVDRLLLKPNNSLNTASTVAWALGLAQPDGWTGEPVLEAFTPRSSGPSYIPRPNISIAGGVYLERQLVELSSKERNAVIRYTVDGSEPGLASPIYRNPVPIESTVTVKAISVGRAGLSGVSRREITVVRGVKSIGLGTPPSEKYASGGALALLDGRRGSDRYTDGRWLGFDGEDLEVLLDFGSPRAIDSLTVGTLSDTASWIFLPAGVELSASADGVQFRPLRDVTSNLMTLSNGTKGVHRFVTTFPGFNDRWLKVVVKNVGVCPPGHSAAGKRAWLFVDELGVR